MQWTKPRVNYKVHCGLWVITMYQCRFINYNWCTTLVGAVATAQAMHGQGRKSIANLCTFSQYCYKTNTVLKNKASLFFKTHLEMRRENWRRKTLSHLLSRNKKKFNVSLVSVESCCCLTLILCSWSHRRSNSLASFKFQSPCLLDLWIDFLSFVWSMGNITSYKYALSVY